MFQFEFENGLLKFQQEAPHKPPLLQLPPKIGKPAEAHP